MTLSAVAQLRQALARLHLAAEAMGLRTEDFDLDQFPEDEQERWYDAADDDIRDIVNGSTRSHHKSRLTIRQS